MDVIDHRHLGGLSVRRAANRFIRFFHIESNLMRILGGWTPRITDSAIRIQWGRHVNQDALHADALRQRLHRLRTTWEMIPLPAEPLRELLEKMNEAPSLDHFMAAIYLFLKPRLRAAYQEHLAQVDSIGDELSIRCLQPIVETEAEQVRWGELVLQARVAENHDLKRSLLEFVADLERDLENAGGLLADSDEVPPVRSDELAGYGTGFWKMRRPAARQMRLGSEFRIAEPGHAVSQCPPYEEFGDPIQKLMLVHHGLMPEHSSLAFTGNLLYEFHHLPWEFYVDFARQTGDEERHILLLLKRLEELGGGPDSFPFPEWTFYDLLSDLCLEDRLVVFNSIVEGDVVENLHERMEIVRQAGDERTAHLMDWICADESLHMLNGMRWLRHLDGDDDLTIDQVLDRGQRVLMDVLDRMRSSERAYDSAAELSEEPKPNQEPKPNSDQKRPAITFYHQRKTPVAPIARQLGGFSRDQIQKLIQSAGGKIIRL
jgi:hypothetical protein